MMEQIYSENPTANSIDEPNYAINNVAHVLNLKMMLRTVNRFVKYYLEFTVCN
jgi:hypothetical protein